MPKNISATTLIHKARLIQTAMNEPMFNTVQPTPAEVEVTINELEQAQGECTGRNYRFVPLRNALKERLHEMLRNQCHCVNGIAQGNEDVLIQSGFPLHKEPTNRPVPEEGLVTSIGIGSDPDTLDVRVKPLKNKSYYMIEVKRQDGRAIQHICSNAHTTIRRVPADMEIAVRVRGANAHGKGPWSEWLTFITPRTEPRNSAGGSSNPDTGMRAA